MSARRLRIELAPSAPLALAVVASHAAAAFCVAAVLPGAAGLAAAALLALFGMVTAWDRALLRSRRSVRALDLCGDKLEVHLAGGECFPAKLGARRYAGRHMVVLSVVLSLRRPVRRTILVTRDMANADLFRRLRIWALWGKLPAVATKQLPA